MEITNVSELKTAVNDLIKKANAIKPQIKTAQKNGDGSKKADDLMYKVYSLSASHKAIIVANITNMAIDLTYSSLELDKRGAVVFVDMSEDIGGNLGKTAQELDDKGYMFSVEVYDNYEHMERGTAKAVTFEDDLRGVKFLVSTLKMGLNRFLKQKKTAQN